MRNRRDSRKPEGNRWIIYIYMHVCIAFYSENSDNGKLYICNNQDGYRFCKYEMEKDEGRDILCV